jgi:endonuclease YncB( thermonuclease family)
MALYEYRAILREIHDADTVILDIDQGFSDWKHNQKIRLDGLNAAEQSTAQGKAATVALDDEVPPAGTELRLKTRKTSSRNSSDKFEKFGRVLGTVYLLDERGEPYSWSLNDWLISHGYASPWDGRGDRPVPEKLVVGKSA